MDLAAHPQSPSLLALKVTHSGWSPRHSNVKKKKAGIGEDEE